MQPSNQPPKASNARGFFGIHASLAFCTAACIGFMAIGVTTHDVRPAEAATCGNDFAEYPFEACDGGDLRGFSCSYFGASGSLGCNVSCTDFVYSGCVYPFCGDGIVNGSEQCDDGNTSNGDGCSSSCSTETPPASCGNGSIDSGENCDDYNSTGGDGCSSSCHVESGFSCPFAGFACTTICGDSIIVGSEACDDGNTNFGDGCDASCGSVESGYSCSGSPSSCSPICGDNSINGSEQCDDGNLGGGDGCDASCYIEAGWLCTSLPACELACGNGDIDGYEACDDDNMENGDGCSASCTIETEWVCSGTPSTCEIACGNSLNDSDDVCDDGNRIGGDGCSAACDAVEFGYTCDYGYPNVCTTSCGDGMTAGSETCDDGNNADGDGCSALCVQEHGYVCSGDSPSTCTVISGTDSFSSDTEAGAGRGHSASGPAPVASDRKANGVKSTEVDIPPVAGNASREQWYSPALETLRQSKNKEVAKRARVLVPAALVSRKEIDELLSEMDWSQCENKHGAASDRRAKRVAVLSPDEQRKRIALDQRLRNLSTRGAVMQRIAELLCLPADYGSTPYKDLDPNSPYAPAIRALTRKELVTGYLDENGKKLDRIGAEDPITAAEIAVLLSRLQFP